ncbi:MAG: ribonuclease BN [Anaerolineaceae bacterium]|nr:ribonuclease BN [Anaerolineaceae bacterium]
MSQIRTIFDLLKATFDSWSHDKAPRLAAALAYYTAFSIAPLLVIVIAVAGLVLGQEAAEGQIVGQIRNEIGEDTAQVIETMLENSASTSSGIVATVLGIAAVALGAAGFFGQLQDALNTVWGVEPKGGGVVAMIKQRFLSFTMVLGIGFLLLVSLVISAVLSSLHNFVGTLLPQAQLLTQLLNIALSLGIITLLFAMIYKVLPDVEIAWNDVWVGSFMTALLFTVGKYLLGLYLGNSGVASTYGVAGSFVVLLLWIYYSAQILLFGAELTQVYARRYGTRIRPADNAVAVSSDWDGSRKSASPAPKPTRATTPPRAAMTYPALSSSVPALPEPVPSPQIDVPSEAEQSRRFSIFWGGLALYNTLVAGLLVALTVFDRKKARG